MHSKQDFTHFNDWRADSNRFPLQICLDRGCKSPSRRLAAGQRQCRALEVERFRLSEHCWHGGSKAGSMPPMPLTKIMEILETPPRNRNRLFNNPTAPSPLLFSSDPSTRSHFNISQFLRFAYIEMNDDINIPAEVKAPVLTGMIKFQEISHRHVALFSWDEQFPENLEILLCRYSIACLPGHPRERPIQRNPFFSTPTEQHPSIITRTELP